MRTLPPLNSLKVFETAGECLNFTLAARNLNVTQGAVSRQIRQLEEYLGVSLFTRTPGKLELTAAGLELLQVIQGSFSEIEKEIASIRDPNLRQRLTILAPPTFCSRWLSPRIGSFSELFPQYELHLYTEKEEGVSFDLEICFEEINRHIAKDRILFVEKYIAVCNQDLLPDCMKLEQNAHRMLHIRHKGDHLPSWADWLAAADIPLPPGHAPGITMSTQEQVINAAIAGSGYAIVDQNMVDFSLKSGALIQFSPLQARSRYGYTLKVSPAKLGIGKVDNFCEWLKDRALDLF